MEDLIGDLTAVPQPVQIKIGFITVWGVSANTRSWWDNSGAARLGYQPTQNAEDFADEILARPDPLDALGQRFQGGSFVGIDYSRNADAA